MHITAVIHVGNHTLPLRKLDLRNNTTIIVIQPTQSSKQEHNELTGAKPGITSKQARPVTTHKKRYLQSRLLHNLSWQHLHQSTQHHQHLRSPWGRAETTRYWIGLFPPIPNYITRQSQHLTTSSMGPRRSS